MTQDEAWSVQRLLEWTTDHLKKVGAASARLESELLLGDALGLKRIELYTHYATIPTEDQRGLFRRLVQRRTKGEPVAYLTGRKEFYSLDFAITPDVLVPRPETEQLVLEGIEFLRGEKFSVGRRPRILDLGTGSGCIAVALAKNLPNAIVMATDLSERALGIARQNAEFHGVAGRMVFRCGDLFKALTPNDRGEKFDLLVSNPPYISDAEYDALPSMVKDFEPQTALLAGPTGTEIAEKIIAEAPNYLVSGGKFLVEMSPTTADATLEIVEKEGHFENCSLLVDFAGLKRTVSAIRR